MELVIESFSLGSELVLEVLESRLELVSEMLELGLELVTEILNLGSEPELVPECVELRQLVSEAVESGVGMGMVSEALESKLGLELVPCSALLSSCTYKYFRPSNPEPLASRASKLCATRKKGVWQVMSQEMRA